MRLRRWPVAEGIPDGESFQDPVDPLPEPVVQDVLRICGYAAALSRAQDPVPTSNLAFALCTPPAGNTTSLLRITAESAGDPALSHCFMGTRMPYLHATGSDRAAT